MTSARKIRANRANAQLSTGPKTALGKTHVSQNARRHGLSLPIADDPAFSEKIDLLAREIVGDTANRVTLESGRRIAEAQVDFTRIGEERQKLILNESKCAKSETEEVSSSRHRGAAQIAIALHSSANQLLALDRYERRALSRRKWAIRALEQAVVSSPKIKE